MSATLNTSSPGDLEAIEFLRDVFPSEQVETTDLARYTNSSEPISYAPLCVVFPKSTVEIQRVIAIANRCEVPVHPISTGKNWGYSSASAPVAGSIILDLSQMNQILKVDSELGYALIEPGVTQGQLYDYLISNEIPLVVDVTGAPRSSSIIGNISERGYGQTRYGDRFEHSAGFEVVLGNGEIVSTGLARFKNNRAKYLYRPGIGPTLDGIFTQSNFGIISKLAIWLMPKPESSALFVVELDSDEELGELCAKVRELRMRGTISSTVHISNDVRVFSTFFKHPEVGNPSALSELEITRLRKLANVRRWTCFGAVHGSKRESAAARYEIGRALGRIGRYQFITDRVAKFALRFSRLSKLVTGFDVETIRALNALTAGIPSDRPTVGAYWRSAVSPNLADLDPARDSCGVLWCAVILPSTKECVDETLAISRNTIVPYGFEVNITYALITDRAMCCNVGIMFDRRNVEQMARAQELYHELTRRFMNVGYAPYRAGTDVSDRVLFPGTDSYSALCDGIKRVCDPKGVISPGKYNIGKQFR